MKSRPHLLRHFPLLLAIVLLAGPACASVRTADDCVRLSEQIKGPKVVARVWRQGQSQFVVIDESNQ